MREPLVQRAKNCGARLHRKKKTECLAVAARCRDKRTSRRTRPVFLARHASGAVDLALKTRPTALFYAASFATAHTTNTMGHKKDYERVPLPPVRRVGDAAYIREQQVVLQLKQSFGVSGVSAGGCGFGGSRADIQADYEISLGGSPVLRSRGAALKLYDEKAVSGPGGEVFRIKTTSIVPKAFSGYDARGERFSVKSKLMSCAFFPSPFSPAMSWQMPVES